MVRHCDLNDLSRTAVKSMSNRCCNRRIKRTLFSKFSRSSAYFFKILFGSCGRLNAVFLSFLAHDKTLLISFRFMRPAANGHFKVSLFNFVILRLWAHADLISFHILIPVDLT